LSCPSGVLLIIINTSFEKKGGDMSNELKLHIYRDLWILAGFLLGLLVGGIVEIMILNFNTIDFPIYYIYGPTMFVGVFFGLWVGPVAWKKIYIDGARGKKYIIK
jgi:Mg/Co/Ni transporter MgtE